MSPVSFYGIAQLGALKHLTMRVTFMSLWKSWQGLIHSCREKKLLEYFTLKAACFFGYVKDFISQGLIYSVHNLLTWLVVVWGHSTVVSNVDHNDCFTESLCLTCSIGMFMLHWLS